jgi:hypothetical protein
MNATIEEYGSVQDIQFPNIPPAATSKEVQQMAKNYVQQIRELAKDEANQPFAAHVMGEMTFMFRVVKLLRRSNIKCVASTTERDTIENADGSKTFKFDFIQFREYG